MALKSMTSAKQASIVQRMKREIVEDVKAGVVPTSVRTFSALHDHTDANEYGGFCAENFTRSDAGVAFANRCQNDVDAWLKTGVLATIRCEVKRALVPPIIHLNGSSAERLIDDISNLLVSLHTTIEKLAQTTPHQRDYYLKPGLWEKAIEAHRERVATLVDMKLEYELLVESILNPCGR
jgi:hypothetical protein